MGRRRGRTCNRGRLGGPLRNRLQHIARFGDVRQVKLGLEFVCRCPRSPAGSRFCVLLKVFLDPLRFVHFDGTGVRFLFSYTDLDESVEDRLALYLELPCQVVNSNLLHSALLPPCCPARLSLHSILTVKFCRPTTASVGPALLLLLARFFFIGNVFVFPGWTLVRRHLSFIGQRSILDPFDDFGLVVLAGLDQFFHAVRPRFRLFIQACNIARLPTRIRSRGAVVATAFGGSFIFRNRLVFRGHFFGGHLAFG